MRDLPLLSFKGLGAGLTGVLERFLLALGLLCKGVVAVIPFATCAFSTFCTLGLPARPASTLDFRLRLSFNTLGSVGVGNGGGDM